MGVAKRYLGFTEHVTLPGLRIKCRWCDEEGHVETEADAEVRTETPVPYDEDIVEAGQDPESAGHEKYWQAYSSAPHYMNATKNRKQNDKLYQDFRTEYVSQRRDVEYSEDKLRAELSEPEVQEKALRSLQ